MFETEELKEKVILIGLDNDKNQMPVENCLEELGDLAKTSGAQVVGDMVQKREGKHPAHYFGKGKLDELKDLISLTSATGVLCDDELSPAQLRNMAERLDTKVMDRTMVILDIFARNAGTAEAKAQVELAQLKYSLSHLSGIGTALSRLGGGIGTRGPGEKKLETDKRHIRNRITELNRQLEEIQTSRSILRDRREKKKIPVISAVGYTNAGKSTLMNTLTQAGVLVEDKLFATLDTTVRKIQMPAGSEALFIDTVGFIQKLPHNLIKAFRATLEEVCFSDILVHVVDATNPMRETQMAVVYQTLKELKCPPIPIVTVFNKTDLETAKPLPADKNATVTLQISAKSGSGIPSLLETVETIINEGRKKIAAIIPFTQGQLLNTLHAAGEIQKEEYVNEGAYVEAYVSEELFNRLQPFLVSGK